MDEVQSVAADQLGMQVKVMAERAHYIGEVTLLTQDGRPLAAVVPMGVRATACPPSALKAAYDAAFSGLPRGMTEEEAKRRLTAALNAAYPHLADLLDVAEERGYRRGLSEAGATVEPKL